ncbi:P-loop NTPase fold protein [Glycomyces tenuis]|uniref:P-loop NTPase fold protein n=1 Tax=Glycomyces tenuis TaxID=58116 RepID=UPI0003FB6211|nr:P-loop NTPase fold protein [Glycomyces tenuis]
MPVATPVREIDPTALLLMSHSYGRLQPYLPRDVDAELDEALAAPGIVVIPSESFSGARRSAYEALLRNMPDALLISHDGRNLDDLHAAVLWADYRDDSRALHRDLVQLAKWQRRGSRWVLILLSQGAFGFLDRDELDTVSPRIVQVRSALTDAERSGLDKHDMYENVSTVEQVFDRAAAKATILGPPSNRGRPRQDEGKSTEFEGGSVGSEAGYHPDTDAGDDHLGITADVHMLADLIASRRVVPPLSIGLFGDWGSGKSFFMRRMRARIRELAQATAAAERATGVRGPAVSAYCSEIRQVTFNAWHYAESNLWASLATHLLDSLASSGSDDDLERHANDLAERRRHQRSLLDQLSSVRVERMLLTAHLERQDRRAASSGDIARALASALAAENWVADGAGAPGDTAEQVRAFIDEATGLSAELRNLWRRLVRSRATRAVVALGAAVAITVFVIANSVVWPAVIAALTVVFSLLPALRTIRASASRIRRVGEELTTRVETPARTRLAELDAEQARIEQAVAELAPSQDLAAFARFRDQSQDYRQHLGVVSLVRRDLETFAAMLACGSGGDHQDAGPERIVLYIDDLDRCPPDVVVKVLEAVHLLLAQPVFTIVVAADPDWLLRSLNDHYGSVLQGGAEASGSGARHYLEKIFQVTLTLAPMTGTGFTRLVTNLLQEREEQPDRNGPSAMQDNPQRAPDEHVTADEPPTDAPQPEPTPPKTDGSSGPDTERLLSRRPNLRPRQLEITAEELDFIASLAPLVHSPRGAKRLINLYRLLRARLRTDELADFLEDPTPGYRAALVLLALTAGPSDPSDLFEAIEDASEHTTWQGLLANYPHLDLTMDTPSDITTYQRWLPIVRRFSFTSDLSS